MPSTLTANLTLDLLDALMAHNLRYKTARKIVGLLPPAGQHVLLTDLRDQRDALTGLTQMWIGDLADRLRITHADATVVRALFPAEATR